ncbi:MAG: glycosyltransferase [Ruminococcaceae bacterium]|nr:glycosyltransferase [Oscillospiraceae bacterium]
MILKGKSVFFWTNYFYGKPDIGTTGKIVSEIEHMRKLGMDVCYTAYLNDGVGIFDNQDRLIQKRRFFSNISHLNSFTRRYDLIKITNTYISSNRFDYCLLRINMLDRAYMSMLDKMKKQGAMVLMESLSYFPDITYRDAKNASLGYYAIIYSLKRNKNRLKNYVDLMLTEGEIDSFYGIPCVEFGMGVDVEKYLPHNYCGDKEELNLIMVGCNSLYHGTDRMIRSLGEYYRDGVNKRPVRLHLVGDVSDDHKSLIKQYSMEDHMILYGPLHGADLDKAYNNANVALGPLAQHRMRKKDTGLKTKEYFAKGIPYVYTGSEPKLEDNYPYILQIPDTEEFVDINEIWSFYDRIKDDELKGERMREKAREVFSWDSIFERTFQKAEEIKRIRR